MSELLHTINCITASVNVLVGRYLTPGNKTTQHASRTSLFGPEPWVGPTFTLGHLSGRIGQLYGVSSTTRLMFPST